MGTTATPDATEAPATPIDQLALSSVTPTPGSNLSPGQTVSFRASAFYNLISSSTARLTLWIQDQEDRNLQEISDSNPVPTVTLSRGSGTASVSDLVRIPVERVNLVRVFVILTPAEPDALESIVQVDYSVR